MSNFFEPILLRRCLPDGIRAKFQNPHDFRGNFHDATDPTHIRINLLPMDRDQRNARPAVSTNSWMFLRLIRGFPGHFSARALSACSTDGPYGSGRSLLTSEMRKHSKPSYQIRSLTSASRKNCGPTSSTYPRMVSFSKRRENRTKRRLSMNPLSRDENDFCIIESNRSFYTPCPRR
jgi:hypothetical protein